MFGGFWTLSTFTIVVAIIVFASFLCSLVLVNPVLILLKHRHVVHGLLEHFANSSQRFICPVCGIPTSLCCHLLHLVTYAGEYVVHMIGNSFYILGADRLVYDEPGSVSRCLPGWLSPYVHKNFF